MMKRTTIEISVLAGLTALAALILYRQLTLLKSKKKKIERSIDEVQPIENAIKLLEVDVIDLLHTTGEIESGEYLKKCEGIAEALRENGYVIVRDSRVSITDNDAFLDMMERYYAKSDGIRDARPEYHYQVGVTPSRVERPRNHAKKIESLTPENKPVSQSVPQHDLKWRFFWRIGDVPKETKFPLLNMDAVIPPEIPEWSFIMDAWGSKMLNALNVTAVMAAKGFGLPSDAFSSRLSCGPHLLAPTGSDYSVSGEEGTVLAGFHYDLNFLTIHGKSRYPGLYVWTRSGQRVAVAVPNGCLLVQAGKQLEYLTGGHVVAGFHEVIVSAATVRAISESKASGRSLWRISSTFFGHIQSDQTLEPLGRFRNQGALDAYPAILAGDQVRKELLAIELDISDTDTKLQTFLSLT